MGSPTASHPPHTILSIEFLQELLALPPQTSREEALCSPVDQKKQRLGGNPRCVYLHLEGFSSCLEPVMEKLRAKQRRTWANAIIGFILLDPKPCVACTNLTARVWDSISLVMKKEAEEEWLSNRRKQTERTPCTRDLCRRP